MDRADIFRRAAARATDPAEQEALERAAEVFGAPAPLAEGWHGVVTVGELLDRLSEIDPALPVALGNCGLRYHRMMKGTAAPQWVRITETGTVVERLDPMGDEGRDAIICVITGSGHVQWPPCSTCDDGYDEGFRTADDKPLCESCWAKRES